MNHKIIVNLSWDTAFDTMEEVEKFNELIGAVHNQMYGAPGIVANELNKNGVYEGTVNYIEVDVNDNRTIPGVFSNGDHVRIIGVPDTDPNHEGRVDFVRGDGKAYVSNMNMPFSGTLNDFFDAKDLEHYTK